MCRLVIQIYTLFMFQMARAYSATVRSLENLPMRATLRIACRVQAVRSSKAVPAFS